MLFVVHYLCLRQKGSDKGRKKYHRTPAVGFFNNYRKVIAPKIYFYL